MPTAAPAIEFPSPSPAPYRGGCVTEPAFFALDYLVNWRADVRVGETVYTDEAVLPLLRRVLADPQRFGVSAGEAGAARDRFLEQAGQTLEQEGGQRAWLEREFRE